MSRYAFTVIRIFSCALTLVFGLLEAYLEEGGTFLTVQIQLILQCLACTFDLQLKHRPQVFYPNDFSACLFIVGRCMGGRFAGEFFVGDAGLAYLNLVTFPID